MKVRVLKSFPYSHDGMKVETLEKGHVFDVRKDLHPGLTEAGFIEDHDGEAAEKSKIVVDIPDAWEKLSSSKLMALAKKVAGEAPADVDAAKAAIAAELASRVD